MALSMHRESNSSGSNGKQQQMDPSKYVRYTPEQVEALERVYAECPKPSSLRRQQLIRECPILANIEPKQIKVWFQNRRCREKQRKEASRLQTVNRKLTAMNKLLMEENDRLQKQVSQLVYENGYMRQQLHTICERSLTSSTGGPTGPPATCFVRAEMLPSGYLIRPCEGGGSIIHIVDHIDFDASSVPEVLRPLYESSKILAQKMTMAALRHIRQIAQETNGEIQYTGGRQPAVLRALSQRLCRGFNDAVNGFVDDGWSIMGSDGVEDNVPPALLVRFLREHRSEWADYGVDVYSAASLKASPYAVPCAKLGGFPSSQVILPLAQTVEHEELCSGIDETTSGACAQLVFAPIDESFGDDAPVLPSGFRVIPLEPKSDGPTATRTLDLASALEVGHGGARPAGEADTSNQNFRSVLTIAFQFTFENHYRDSVAAMARQYVRSIVGSVQRVAMAIAPSQISSQIVPKPLPGSPEAVTLARWICRSYRVHTGGELLQADAPAGDAVLKQLWHHTDAIMCCSVRMNASAVFTFANQAGLDMLETTLVALQDIMLEKILDEAGRKILLSEFSKIMQQGFAYLPGGVCVSSMGRPVSYEQAVAWKVVNDEDSNHCLAFMFMNWSFV
ncbi:UNVERIFIED_CONTAM: Homeobox-leucine zipper protein ATHB-14 [Sesamum radiatum]|uniref:Homeobox-leucine zipper protein ATHB-14 n=1 Tax=Sesamum radiatum TaxID=300843 RepID=A0AAW2T0Z4_SESRA